MIIPIYICSYHFFIQTFEFQYIFFFFFFGGGGGVSEKIIWGGMKILWILFWGHHLIGLGFNYVNF